MTDSKPNYQKLFFRGSFATIFIAVVSWFLILYPAIFTLKLFRQPFKLEYDLTSLFYLLPYQIITMALILAMPNLFNIRERGKKRWGPGGLFLVFLTYFVLSTTPMIFGAVGTGDSDFSSFIVQPLFLVNAILFVRKLQAILEKPNLYANIIVTVLLAIATMLLFNRFYVI